MQTYGKSNPLNFTLEEWQQAQRVGIDPRELKPLFQEAWAQSDNLKSLSHALEERGLFIARGDRRGFVGVDIDGNVYALARWTGIKTKDLKARLGSPDGLPSAQHVTDSLKPKKIKQVRDYIDQMRQRHDREMRPFRAERARLVTAQRAERADVNAKQNDRWIQETKERSDRLNTGLRGLFDRLTGTRREIISQNEREALACSRRDQEQRDRLIQAQMVERQELQDRALKIRTKHKQERKQMAKTISLYMKRSNPERQERIKARRNMPGRDLER